MSKHILAVEDSATQAEALRSLLATAGYEVTLATSGEAALTQFEVRQYDAVISDIVMPGPIDGYELCRRIKAGPRRETAVLLLTSLSDPMDIIKGLECGADNFFTKPYHAPHLLERLHVLFDTKAARRQSKMRMGIKVVFMGREFSISSEREQILDLLISTFEDAVRQNRELREREAELEAARAALARRAGTLEARLESIMRSVPDVLFSRSPDRGETYYISPSATAVCGYTPNELMQAPLQWIEAVHDSDLSAYRDFWQGAVESGKPQRLEYRLRHRDGSLRWIEETLIPVADTPGQVIRLDGIARDVTERNKLEQQLHQAQKMESVGRLAGGVAHDFNNLLTVILGETEIALGELPGEHSLREALGEVLKAGERAAGLTRQLLMFSRQEVLQPTVFNPTSLVLDLDKMLRRLLGEDVELVTLSQPDVGSIKADPGQVEQILVNLLVNARDAMPDGGKLTVEIGNVTLDEEYAKARTDVSPGEYVCLAVSDTGSGMSEAVKARIFEPFFTTKERGRGTGLGLATCYGIVKQAGGHIAAYSELGVGTTMRVYLPQARERPAAKDVQAVEPELRGGEAILLVEDEAAVRQTAAKMLEKQGYHVKAVANGEEALRVLQQKDEPVDLLLTDVVLTGMNGRVLAERARAMRPGIKVLFTSGYTSDVALRSRIIDEGAVLVNKPFTAQTLGKKVRQVLDG